MSQIRELVALSRVTHGPKATSQIRGGVLRAGCDGLSAVFHVILLARPRTKTLRITEKHGARDPQGTCQGRDILQSDVALSTFNASDVCPVESSQLGKRLLRDSQTTSPRAHSESKSLGISKLATTHTAAIPA
jgi:hypothetical protein